METPSEAPDRHPARGWLGYLGRVVTLLTAILLIYIVGAIAARVCYLKGVLPDGSGGLAFAETVFAPLNYPYGHSQFFRSGYDWCVALFVPEQKSRK